MINETSPTESHHISQRTVFLAILILIILFIGFAVYLKGFKKNNTVPTRYISQKQTPAASPQAVISQAPVSVDTTEAGLNALDNQLTSLDADLKEVDKGLDDLADNLEE
jgi:hypothetical protein